MGSINDLLNDVSTVIQKHEKADKNSQNYNLFQVLEVTDKEVMICKVLTDLLSPQGLHNKGITYLRSFLEDVLDMKDIQDELLNTTYVSKEYPIVNDRRIDIVIKNHIFFIPIEVKIYAGEQQCQCLDYYKHALKFDPNAKVIYLTISGTSPSDYSTVCEKDGIKEKISQDKIMCISFKDDIRLWLEKILISETGVMKQMISQYLDAINLFTGQPDEEKCMEIAKEITKNEINFRTGLQIASNMNLAKAELMKNVMEEFENQMQSLVTKYNLEKESRSKWYSFEQHATEEFYQTYSTYPGLNYVVKNAKFKDDKSMWLRIEIEHNLFAGFCMFDYYATSEEGLGDQVDVMSDEIKQEIMQYLNLTEIDNLNWWVLWYYLPTGANGKNLDQEAVPNFKNMNEAAIQLADDVQRGEFVKLCVSVIENNLLRLLK